MTIKITQYSFKGRKVFIQGWDSNRNAFFKTIEQRPFMDYLIRNDLHDRDWFTMTTYLVQYLLASKIVS